MIEDKVLLPPPPDHPLLDQPEEEKLRQEVESLRRQLEEEKNRNRKKDNKGGNRPTKRTLWIIGGILIAILLVAFFVGFLPHHRREQQLKEEAQVERNALPVLSYIRVQRSPTETELQLPGSIEAFTDAPILARADGYLKSRFVDIGDHVRAGQLLAQITAPDLDQQVEQARAQLLQGRASARQSRAALEQARANQSLAKVTAGRYAGLLTRGAVSPQDNDTRQADYRAQTANVAALEEAVAAQDQNVMAMQANLDRLLELQSYEQVRAPFAGVITLRNIDTGALISSSQTLLFRESQVDPLRTYLYVPEANAPLVQVGQRATLSVQEFPGRTFGGEITRTSDSLDPSTRTLLTEVQIPNGANTLYPGMFSEVSLKQTRVNPPVLVPGDALIVNGNGTFIAVLQGDATRREQEEAPPAQQANGGQKSKDSNSKGENKDKKKDKNQDKNKNKDKEDPKKKTETIKKQQQELPTFTVHLVQVSVGRDYGNAVEILTGLKSGERIVESPNDHVQEGAQVKGQQPKENPINGAPGQTGKQSSNIEKLNPQPNAEPEPKQPSKEKTTRAPGY